MVRTEEGVSASVGSDPKTEVLANPPFSKTGGRVDCALGVVLGLDLRKDSRERESLEEVVGVSSLLLRPQPNHDLCRVCWVMGEMVARTRRPMEIPGEALGGGGW